MNLRLSILGRSLLILGSPCQRDGDRLPIQRQDQNGPDARKPVITKPKFDPSAEQVEFFKGMEDGLIETRYVPKGCQWWFSSL